jgi:hypothetical protein
MATPLDEERARLREAGYTDEEISRYFVERLRGEGQAPATGGGAAPQGNMSGVLGNANAVLGHVRATIPVVASATANLSNPAASPGSRFKSAVVLAGIGLIVCVLGFAIWQEWQQHIIYETEIKRLNTEITRINVELTTAQNEKAKAEASVAKQVAAGQVAQATKAEEDAKVAPEVARGQAADARKKEAEAKYAEELAEGQKAQACTQRMEMLAKTLSMNDLLSGVGMDEYNKDCNPKFAGCTGNFDDLIATIKVPLDEIKHFSEHTKEIDEKLTAYKSKCGWHEKDRDAAIEAYRSIGLNLKPPSPQPTETAEAREPEPTPTPTPAPSYTAPATPEPPPIASLPTPEATPLRTPVNFDCINGKHMGADFVICDSPQLLDTLARLEDSYNAAHAARGGSVLTEQVEWLKHYGQDCGLPYRGRPAPELIEGARGCVQSAMEQRIRQLAAER